MGVEQGDSTPELLSALMPARRPTLHTIPIPSIPPFRPTPPSVLHQTFDDTPYSTTQTFFVHVTRIRSKPSSAQHPRRRDSMSRSTWAPSPAHRAVDSGNHHRAGVSCSSSRTTRRRLPLLAPPRSPVRRGCQVDPRRLRGGFAKAPRRPFLPRGTLSTKQRHHFVDTAEKHCRSYPHPVFCGILTTRLEVLGIRAQNSAQDAAQDAAQDWNAAGRRSATRGWRA